MTSTSVAMRAVPPPLILPAAALKASETKRPSAGERPQHLVWYIVLHPEQLTRAAEGLPRSVAPQMHGCGRPFRSAVTFFSF